MRKILLAVVLFGIGLTSHAYAIDLFGKGSVSKSYLSADSSTVSVSLAGGFAFAIFPFVRVEARYSNISTLQNKIQVETASFSGILSDINTQTAIYSLGLDIDFLSDKYLIQPFIYIGMGYIETERSYYFTLAGTSNTQYFSEPKTTGITANAGAGLRIRFAKSFALELEVFGYAVDLKKPNLANVYGTAGVRVSI